MSMFESLTIRPSSCLEFNTPARIHWQWTCKQNWIGIPRPDDSTIAKQPLPPNYQNLCYTWSNSVSEQSNPLFDHYWCRHGISSRLLFLCCLGFGKMNDITSNSATCVSQMNTFVSLNLQTLFTMVKSGPIWPCLNDANDTCWLGLLLHSSQADSEPDPFMFAVIVVAIVSPGITPFFARQTINQLQ